MVDSLDLKKGARILDFGGNNFSEYLLLLFLVGAMIAIIGAAKVGLILFKTNSPP